MSYDRYHRFSDGYEGYLQKQSKLFKSWRPFYCVLSQHILRIYPSEADRSRCEEFFVDADTLIYEAPPSLPPLDIDININSRSQMNADDADYVFYLQRKESSGTERLSDSYYYEEGSSYDQQPATVDDSSALLLCLRASSLENRKEWMEALHDSKHDGFKLIYQPDLWPTPFYPATELLVSYESSTVSVLCGNILRPRTVEHPPSAIQHFMKDQSSHLLHSLLMIDLDSVRCLEKGTAYLHWAAVNITGTDMSSGFEVAKYESPTPELGTGLHRFFFLLFQQPHSIPLLQLVDMVNAFSDHRRDFSHRQWTRLLGCGDPVGVNGFYAGWEQYCDLLRTEQSFDADHSHHRHLQHKHRDRGSDSGGDDSMASVQSFEHINPVFRGEIGMVELQKCDLFFNMSLADIFSPSVDITSQPIVPSLSLTVHYPDWGSLHNSIHLPPTALVDAPTITFTPHDPNTTPVLQTDPSIPPLYTLLVVDPDYPSAYNTNLRENILWVVVNIPGGDIDRGVVILPYLSPDPSRGSGMHRFIFSLYMQKSAFGDDDDCDDSRRFFTQRKGIRSYEWVMRYRDQLFTVPVALAVFTSQHEDDTLTNINNSTPSPTNHYLTTPSATPNKHHLTSPSATPPWSPIVRRPYSRDRMHLFGPSLHETVGFSPLNKQQYRTNNSHHHFPSSGSLSPSIESIPHSPSISYLRGTFSSSSIKAPPLVKNTTVDSNSFINPAYEHVPPSSETSLRFHSSTTVQYPLRNTTSNIFSYIGDEEEKMLHSQAMTSSSTSSVVESTYPPSDFSNLTSREMDRQSGVLKEDGALDQRLTDDLSLSISSGALRRKQQNNPSQISDGSVGSINNRSTASSQYLHNSASNNQTNSDRTSGSVTSNLMSSLPPQSDLSPSSSIILLTNTFPPFSDSTSSQSPAYNHGPFIPPSKQDGPSMTQPSIIDSKSRSAPNRNSVSTASTIDQTTIISSNNTADARPVLEAMNQTMVATTMSQISPVPIDSQQAPSMSSTHMQSANTRSLTSESLDRYRLRVERSYSLHADFSSRFRSARLSLDTGGGIATAGDTALDMGSIYDKNYISSSNRNFSPDRGVVDEPSSMSQENSSISTHIIVIPDTKSSISDGKNAAKLQRSGWNAEDRSDRQGDPPVDVSKTDSSSSSSDRIDTRVLTKRLSEAVQMWRNIFVSDVSQIRTPDTMTVNASVPISRISKQAYADAESNKLKPRSESIANHAAVDDSSETMLTAVDNAVMSFDLSTRKMTTKEKEWLAIVTRNKQQIKKAYDDDDDDHDDSGVDVSSGGTLRRGWNDDDKSLQQELVDSTILPLPPADHLRKKAESSRQPLDESEDWRKTVVRSSNQIMMSGQEDRQEVAHSISKLVVEVADISPSKKMADKEREWMERLKRNKEQSAEVDDNVDTPSSPDASKKTAVTDFLATRKLSAKEVQWLQIIQSKKDREEAERQEKVRMQRESERSMRSEYDKKKQGLEDLIYHQKKKDRLLHLREKQSRGQRTKDTKEEQATQVQPDLWMEEKKREQEEYVSIDAMDHEQLEEELRVRELEEEPRIAAEVMGMVEGGSGGENLTDEQHHYLHQSHSHHGQNRLLPRQAGYYDTASHNSSGLLSVEAKDRRVMSAVKMRSTDKQLNGSKRDDDIEPSYGDEGGGTVGAGDNDDEDVHDDDAADIVDTGDFNDGDEDGDGDEQMEGYDESETRDDGKEAAGVNLHMLHFEDTHDGGWEGGLNSYDEQRRREWIDVQRARLEMALSQQGEEEQVMYARLEQLEQEKLDYDLRMYEQKQRLRVDLIQSKLDYDGKSEVGRDTVQLMLKASESNSHAELEKMKLSLLEKAKQEVLEQLSILEQQRVKEEHLLREQRRLDGVMADINVKLLLDNNPSSASSKVVMGGSGQEIWMGKQSMLNTAYDLQGYEGIDRDDDDNDVYDGGDDNNYDENDDGGDGNDDGGDDNNDDENENDDGGDDNDDGGDDNDQQVEGNDYGDDVEDENEDVDTDEGNEYFDDDENAGDDYAESDARDDSEEHVAEDVDIDDDDDDHLFGEEEYDDGDFQINQDDDGYGYEEEEDEEVIHNEGEEYLDDTENDEDDRYSNAAADDDAYDDDGDNEANGDDVDNIAGDDGDNEEVGSEEYNAYSEENAFSTEWAGSDAGEDSGTPVRVVRFSDVNSYLYFVVDEIEEEDEEEEYDDGSDDDDYNEEDGEEYFEDPDEADDDDDDARY